MYYLNRVNGREFLKETGVTGNLTERKATVVILVLFLGISWWFFNEPFTALMNDVTRADLSQHVSNQSCVVGVSSEAEYHASCPGKLKCYEV